MNDPKYIMILNHLGIETPVIFPFHTQHSDIMEMMGKTKRDIIGAGFIRVSPLTGSDQIELASGVIQDVKHTCYGESLSIGVKSQPEDSIIVDQMYFGR